jgi:hypothetical protein
MRLSNCIVVTLSKIPLKFQQEIFTKQISSKVLNLDKIKKLWKENTNALNGAAIYRTGFWVEIAYKINFVRNT